MCRRYPARPPSGGWRQYSCRCARHRRAGCRRRRARVWPLCAGCSGAGLALRFGCRRCRHCVLLSASVFAANKKPLIHLGREVAKPSWYHPHSSQRATTGEPRADASSSASTDHIRPMLRPANGGHRRYPTATESRSGRCSQDHSARSPAPASTLPARCCGPLSRTFPDRC